MMEILLDRQQTTVNEIDTQTQQMLPDAKSMYADAEASANTTTKQEEGLNACSLAISKLG
jgi:hypothetical protein